MDFAPEQLPDTLVVEHGGAQIPLRDVPFVKEAPDLATLVKNAYEAHREVGARVRLPSKEAKPEEVAAFRKRVYDAGVFPAPPGTPEDYGIVKPASLPDGLTWNEPFVKRFTETLHKHGAPKALAAELLALHQEVVAGTAEGFSVTAEEGTAALKQEFGDRFEELADAAGRVASQVMFKTPEELAFFNALGISNHPLFLGPLMRIAPAFLADSSFVAEMNRAGSGSADTGAAAQTAAREEIAKLMDSKHPEHGRYLRHDPEIMERLNALYRKAYGAEKVQIG